MALFIVSQQGILNDKVLIPALMRYLYGSNRYHIGRISWITLIIIRVNVDSDNKSCHMSRTT